MHLAGVIGMNLPLTADLFLSLSGLNLFASFLIVFSFHRDWSPAFIRMIVIFALAGFGVEVLGTNFGFPFGHYRYGEALGFSVFGVPLIMGLTWALLLYSTAVASSYLFNGKLERILLASFLMVFTDFFIEPLAGQLDFWHWAGGHAPFINFVGWFFVSVLLHTMFFVQELPAKNKAALIYYPVVTLFFMLLNFI